MTKAPIDALDGLRAVAVLLVLFEHLPKSLMSPTLANIHLRMQPGYAGVDIFFVLSGFLITRILLVDRERGWPLRYFLLRRMLRIFPILYLTVAVVWILRPGPELPWVAAYIGNYFFAENGIGSPLAHTWSLAVEEHYYLFWPPLVYWLGPRWSRRIALGVLMPAAVGLAIWKTFDEPLGPARREIQAATQYRMFSLAAGSALAWSEGWIRLRPRLTQVLGLTAAVAGYAVVHQSFWWSLENRHGHYLAAWLVGFGAISAGLLLMAVGGNGRGGPLDLLLRSRPLRHLGKISYGMYLYHVPIFWALGSMGAREGQSWERFLLALAVSWAVAELSFALIERPILGLQKRFRAA